MTRIHLTLDSKYVPNWGMKEGLRELIQNWLDAGGRGRPTHADGRLTLDNPGAEMNREVLLIGHSTKPGTDARGQFGEGLKLGTLALLRDGCSVTVETAGERWDAVLDSHPILNRSVLAWDIIEGGSTFEGVRVIVNGLTGEDWASMRRVFIWDSDPTRSSLLQSEDYKGAVYVKGIHVCDNDELAFGYNIHNLKTDRDRKLVDNFELAQATNRIMLEALDKGEVSGKQVLSAFMRSTLECYNPDYRYKVGESGRQALTDAWVAEHGNAVPCGYYDYEVAEKLRKLGKRALNVRDQLVKLLDVPNGAQVLRDLKDGRIEHKMSALEQRNFNWAQEMAKHGVPFGSLPRIEPTKFIDEVGAVHDGGTLYLNAKCLDSHTNTLCQLAHSIPDFNMAAVLDHIIKTNGGVTR